MIFYLVIALACAFCIYVSLAPQLPNMQEGRWEIKMEILGMFLEMPEKHTQCLTKNDCLPQLFFPKYECKINSPPRIIRNFVWWSVICRGDGGEIQGNGYIRYRGTTFKGSIGMRIIESDMRRFKIHLEGFRIGDCE